MAVYCSESQCGAVCCSVLQCVAVCFSSDGSRDISQQHRSRGLRSGLATCCSVVQCVAVCCSVLQCVAVCCSILYCSVLQCVAVCCSVLQRIRSGMARRGVSTIVLFYCQSSSEQTLDNLYQQYGGLKWCLKRWCLCDCAEACVVRPDLAMLR